MLALRAVLYAPEADRDSYLQSMNYLPRCIAAKNLLMVTCVVSVASFALCWAICACGQVAGSAKVKRPVTLWSADSQQAPSRNPGYADHLLPGTTEAPLLYRLPAANVMRMESGITIENRFSHQAELTSPCNTFQQPPRTALPARTDELAPQRRFKSRRATTASASCSDAQVVAHLPMAVAPPPPTLVSRRTGNMQGPKGPASLEFTVPRQSTPPARDRLSSPMHSADLAPTETEGIHERERRIPVTTTGTELLSRYDYSPPNTPTVAQISAQVEPAVCNAYSLAQRGALYAAQAELIDVLRRIAHARDAAFDTHQHAQSLAEGLRALDEADDFVPAGARLEADLDVCSIARAHRTEVLHSAATDVLPHEAVAAYHELAHEQLGLAVAGEQAGSMVLYGLGKIFDRQAQSKDYDLQSTRKGMTMYRAALVAHSGNYLAANELGVLMARNGHFYDALALFDRVARQAPHAVAYHNLAIVQRQLGDHARAAQSQQEANRLAYLERSTGLISRRQGVDIVTPAELARVGQPPQIPPASPVIATDEPNARESLVSAVTQAVSRNPRQKLAAALTSWPWQRRSGGNTPVDAHPIRIARPGPRMISAPPSYPRMDPVRNQPIVR